MKLGLIQMKGGGYLKEEASSFILILLPTFIPEIYIHLVDTDRVMIIDSRFVHFTPSNYAYTPTPR